MTAAPSAQCVKGLDKTRPKIISSLNLQFHPSRSTRVAEQTRNLRRCCLANIFGFCSYTQQKTFSFIALSSSQLFSAAEKRGSKNARRKFVVSIYDTFGPYRSKGNISPPALIETGGRKKNPGREKSPSQPRQELDVVTK